MSSIISVKVRKGWAFVFTRACTSEPTWLFSRIHLSRSVFASLPLWLVIWLELDRLHHGWKPHYIRPASLARRNKSHFKQLVSDQEPAGEICVPCVLVDQDTCFVFLAMSSDGRLGWTGSALVLLSVSKEASDLVGVGVLVFSSHVSVWEHHICGWWTTSVCLGSDQ